VSGFSASLTIHIALLMALLFGLRARARPSVPLSAHPDRADASMIWLNAPGPGGGGGGGGNRMKDPARRAELPGRDPMTVPAAKSRALDVSTPVTTEPEPVSQQLIVPVATLASAIDALPRSGAIEAPPSWSSVSHGPGREGGVGTGQGTGDGPGRGRGLGDGQDAGTGGDVYRPGNGVTMPIEIRKGMPRYTTEAMRARIQGSVLIECVVEINGTCTRIRVKRSFDPAFGLDEQAVKAAAEWRFRPGTRRGQPVPVLVTMEIAFALR
jgi:protein TonB